MDVAVEFGGEEIVLYFKIDADGVDAQTFGNALIRFDNLYRTINEILNPGLEIEIEFIRSDPGSIRAVLRSFKKDTQNLLKHPFLYVVYPFLIAILANNLTSQDVKVIINDDSYIVKSANQEIVLPRQAEHKAAAVERSPSVRRSVRDFFAVVESDQNIKSVDFRSPRAPEQPVIPVDREKFSVLRELPEVEELELPKKKRETYYRQSVVVVTAVLEKSTNASGNFSGMDSIFGPTFTTIPSLKNCFCTSTNSAKAIL